MFKREFIGTEAEMVDKILHFVSEVSGVPYSSKMRVLADDGYNVLWFCDDSSVGGISVWATDKTEKVENPWEAKSTYAIAGKYALDMDRQELDVEKTAQNKEKAKQEAFKEYQELYKSEKEMGFKGCPVSTMWYKNKLEEIDALDNYTYDVYRTKTYRRYTTNPFHMGGILKFANVSSNKVILDMHYTEGVFSFNLFSQDNTPATVQHLVIGCYRCYAKEQSQRVFIMTSAFRLKSDTKLGKYRDSFLLESGYKRFDDTTADCPGNEIISDAVQNNIYIMAKIDIDNQINHKKHFVNGEHTPLRWHVSFLHLSYRDEDTFPVGTVPAPLLIGWESYILHTTYEYELSEVGANYASLSSYSKADYEIWDDLRGAYKTFPSPKRAFVCDTVNKTTNNNSLIMPLIFYCERDPHILDRWSAIGQCDIVNFINVYNISDGRIYQTSYDRDVSEFASYNLCRRRMASPHGILKIPRTQRDEVTETWGYSGYVGLAVKLDRRNKVGETN